MILLMPRHELTRGEIGFLSDFQDRAPPPSRPSWESGGASNYRARGALVRSRFSKKIKRWTATGRAISGAVKRPLRPRFVGKYRPGAVHVMGVATAPGPLRTTTTTTTTNSSKMRVEVRPGRRARDFFGGAYG